MSDEQSKRYQSVLFTFHAVQQMAERKIIASQVEQALEEGRMRPGRDDAIVAELTGDDGKTLRVVFVEMRDGEARIARIVTVIRIGTHR
jgi:hypothetical protein